MQFTGCSVLYYVLYYFAICCFLHNSIHRWLYIGSHRNLCHHPGGIMLMMTHNLAWMPKLMLKIFCLLHLFNFFWVTINWQLTIWVALIKNLLISCWMWKLGVTGFQYAGLQNRDECRCGNFFGLYGKASEAECNMNCPGNHSHTCGGRLRNSVYYGNYRKNIKLINMLAELHKTNIASCKLSFHSCGCDTQH